MMTKQEEGIFLMLYNRSGYVLNFSTNNFDYLQPTVLVRPCGQNRVFQRVNFLMHT